jgi:long-chain acyl-CoA synthetase
MTGTIPELLAERAAAHGTTVVLRKKDRGLWKAVNWSELDRKRRAVAAALIAAALNPADVAGILTETTPEAVYADLGILSAGGVSLALNPDADAEAIGTALRDSHCRLLFVENEEQLDKALTVRETCPALSRIVILDMKGLRDFADPGCESFETFVARATPGDLPAIRPDSPAAIIGGNTHTHAELHALIAASQQQLGPKTGDERLAVLPMSDPLERIHGLYLALSSGVVSNYLESPETARENLQELKPTLFGADTEAWTRLHARIAAAAAAATFTQRALYRWAIRAGSRNALANILVLQAVRRELGMQRLRVAYVANAKPPAEVTDWAAALGVSIQSVTT